MQSGDPAVDGLGAWILTLAGEQAPLPPKPPLTLEQLQRALQTTPDSADSRSPQRRIFRTKLAEAWLEELRRAEADLNTHRLPRSAPAVPGSETSVTEDSAVISDPPEPRVSAAVLSSWFPGLRCVKCFLLTPPNPVSSHPTPQPFHSTSC